MGTTCNIDGVNVASCLVASIPANMLQGTHNVAVFDMNNDGWKDLVIGRCTGTQIWMNQPPLVPVGSIEDESGNSHHALTVDKDGLRVLLYWGDSCNLADTNYSVYRGTFNPANMAANTFTNHGQLTCNTNNLNTYSFAEAAGSFYYLVVPHNGTWEGSYGVDSNGTPRQQGSGGNCFVQNVGACP